MRKIILCITLCFTFLCSCVSQNEGTGPTVLEIEAALNNSNPQQALDRYLDCENTECEIFEKISSGSKDWINVAVKILAYADAGSTEGILSSLGKAMQKVPQNVLPLVNKKEAPLLSADWICLPFISGEIPVEEQLAEVVNSRKAIETVHNDQLREQKEACLADIRSLEAQLRKDLATSQKK